MFYNIPEFLIINYKRFYFEIVLTQGGNLC